ncbi:nitroreductase family protein [Nocardia stercoris]|uniref:nitroreductase family protein n=1 Tax=Nocardia stercoris TaxID=2483361 RepID=UPI001F15B193|nr:nitroreductase family protein [Nocardia stercoris]
MEQQTLHPLLRARYSPAGFDPDHEVTVDEIDLLLEAARWAPSAGNSQPWAFVPARRGDPIHPTITRHLARSSRAWAADASALIVNLTRRFVDDTDLPYSDFADYDLGQAVAHLTIQAQAMDLACHQFRAFDLAALSADLAPAPGWHIVSMTAIGRPAGPLATERGRRSVADLRRDAFAPN